MSKSIKFVVKDNSQIPDALQWVKTMAWKGIGLGPVEITLGRESKRRNQEAKYHCLITDVMQLSPSKSFAAWKCLLVKWFDEYMKKAGTPLSKPGERILDSINKEYVYLRPSTTEFKVGEAADFIEFLYSFGSENDVNWSKQSTAIYNSYKEVK